MPYLTIPNGNVTFHYIIPSCPDRVNQYLDADRPTILLLHPRFFDVHFMAPQYRDARLSKGYNLLNSRPRAYVPPQLCIDHHYHGKTIVPMDDEPYDFMRIADDLLAALDVLNVDKFHAFGNSLGAPIAVRMRVKAPERVLSLVLCAKHPPVETDENLEQYRFLRDACYENADDGSDRLASDVVHALHWIYFGDEDAPKSVKVAIDSDSDEMPSAESSVHTLIDEWIATSPFRPSNPRLITKIFSSLLDRIPIEPQLWKTITCPVLILHGENDVPYPVQVAYDHHEAMSNAEREIHIVPGAPHFLSWTHPAIVNTYIADFYDRITGVDSKKAALEPIKSVRPPDAFEGAKEPPNLN